MKYNFFSSNLSLYPDDDFSGVYEEYFDDGSLQYRGKFDKGCVRQGQHIEFWENGSVRELSFWKDNWILGTAISFYQNGNRESEIDYFEEGSRVRRWIEKSYSERGKLMLITYHNGDVSTDLWQNEVYASLDLDTIVDKHVAAFDENLNSFVDDFIDVAPLPSHLKRNLGD